MIEVTPEEAWKKREKAMEALSYADPAYGESSGDRANLEFVSHVLEEYISVLDDIIDATGQSYEAKLLKSISIAMDCRECPLAPCNGGKPSSMANCIHKWSDALAKISPETDWEEVRLQVARTFRDVP